MLASVFIAACGLVYELVAGACQLPVNISGAAVSTVIGVYLFSMGVIVVAAACTRSARQPHPGTSC
ncbi:MAG: hypothetical protein R3E68_21785 [Burkholderiaceae bacterium]